MLLRLLKFVEYKMSMSICKYTRIRNTDAIAFNTDHDKFSVFVCLFGNVAATFRN